MKEKSMPRTGMVLVGLVLLAHPLFAGFGSTEIFLPAVGRVPGQEGAATSAPGTVLGKPMKSLGTGEGMVPMLVMLR
jgi:hypothetical protein